MFRRSPKCFFDSYVIFQTGGEGLHAIFLRTWPKSGMNSHDQIPDWSGAPDGWNWQAQDEDGRWFWYRVWPEPSIGGGVWRGPSRALALAAEDVRNPEWGDPLLLGSLWKAGL